MKISNNSQKINHNNKNRMHGLNMIQKLEHWSLKVLYKKFSKMIKMMISQWKTYKKVKKVLHLLKMTMICSLIKDPGQLQKQNKIEKMRPITMVKANKLLALVIISLLKLLNKQVLIHKLAHGLSVIKILVIKYQPNIWMNIINKKANWLKLSLMYL